MVKARAHPKLLVVILICAVIGFAFLIYTQAVPNGSKSSSDAESPKTLEIVDATKTPGSVPIDISTDSDIVPDDNLEIAVRKQINKPTGQLVESDLEKVIELIELRNVTDLTGLEHCINLTYLDLHGMTEPQWITDGDIRVVNDPAPLNHVSDLSPLVNNPGLGEGDIIDLRDNGLSKEAKEIYVPELRSRGVKVLTD